MEELKRFQGSTFDTISRRKLVEDRDTIQKFTGKIRELQNEIKCMNGSRDSQDAESVRSGQSDVTSQQVFFPPHPDPGGMLSRSLGMPSRNNGPPSIWDTHDISGNVFVNPTASSSAPYPQESNPWISNVSEHTSPHVMSESQTPAQDRQPEIQSFLAREDLQRIMEQTNNDCRFQILIFDKFTTSATFACWNIDIGQFFITLDEEVPDEMKNLRREYTLFPRNEEASWVRGWILRNTKIGPVLDVKVCVHEKRYGIEIKVDSLFRDRTVSWFRIVNGIHKYLTGTSEAISTENFEHRVTGRLVAKAKPQPKPTATLSPMSILVRERNWKDINPERHHSRLFRSVRSHEITATWFINSSRRWWSSTVWRLEWKVQGRIRWHFGMDSWCLGKFLGKRRRTEEKISILLWTLILPSTSCTSEQFRDIGEAISLILHCMTVHCCQRTSLSTSITSEMLVKYIQ